MKLEFNFGTLKQSRPAGEPRDEERFRIAVLGDFSARAHRGQLATGRELGARKPWTVDVDNFAEVLRRRGIRLQLPLGSGGESVPVTIESLDDFHPDALYDHLEVFRELADWRQRLQDRATFAEAAREVQAWLGTQPGGAPPPPAPEAARGTAVPEGQLDDFTKLLGRPSASETAAAIQVRELRGN